MTTTTGPTRPEVKFHACSSRIQIGAHRLAIRVLARAIHRGDRFVVALYDRLVDLEDHP